MMMTEKNNTDILLNTTTPIPELIKALRSEEKTIRKDAAELLASIGDEAIAPLAALLGDDWWVVRYRACEALGLMEKPDAYPHLRAAVSDERDHVRYMAAKGLGRLGIPEAALYLEPLLEDENSYVRKMAAGSIARLRG